VTRPSGCLPLVAVSCGRPRILAASCIQTVKLQVVSLMILLWADQNREDCSAVPGLGGDAPTVGRILPPCPGPHRVR
jgi:hypothetical protein